jgi:uncharacterized repeat protein (TIGR04138 family)
VRQKGWTDIIISPYSVDTAMSQQHQQQERRAVPEVNWQHLAEVTGPYPVEAFQFVRDGLSYAARSVHEDIEERAEQDRHITGQQLCLGLRKFAIERYGLMAPVVLAHWHIRRTDDFGRIVFAMVGQGLLSKTEEDSLDDFRAVFDFDEAFSASEVMAGVAAN